MLYSLFGAILLVEEWGDGVKIIAKFGDSGASGVGWYDEYRVGVDGHDEGGVQQGVVNGGLHRELKKEVGAATKVGLDRGEVRI